MQTLLARLCALPLLFSLGLSAPQEETNRPDDVAEIKATLLQAKDGAEVDLVKRLSNLRTRDALEALFEVYDAMETIYMKRAVCQGLALYDDVQGAEQPALEKLMNVAVEARERDLRLAAVELLGSCDNFGPAFLRMIVESGADDEIRERALKYHIAQRRDEDSEWYREIYDPTEEEKAKKEARRAKETDKIPYQLQTLRELAFEALVRDLEAADLIEATADKNRKIQAAAIRELDSRGDKNAVEVAEDIYKAPGVSVPTRLVAAKVLLDNLGTAFGEELIDDAARKETPREFAFGIADILSAKNDPELNEKLLKKAGAAKGDERFFYLRATAHLDDPKLVKSIVKLLKDKDPACQRAAAEALGRRRSREALPELMALIEKGSTAKGPGELVVTAAIEAATEIRKNDAEWEQALVGYAERPEESLRNAALTAIGRTKNPDYLPILVTALDHGLWSTRLAAAHAIETMHLEAGVGPLCARVGKEGGRMLHELAEVLFRLTGESFGTNARQWESWWKKEGATFKIPTESDLRRREDEAESRRLRQTTRSEFFGIRIESHRVIFVLDVSGSMNDPLRGQYVGDKGEPRINLAKAELMKAIEALDPNSFFNIVTFSSDVDAWRDSVVEKTDATVAEARAFVERLGAEGATNLFAALELAFSDPDVDTIFVLSDGEPSGGELNDGGTIRDVVAAWNKNRGVVIHTIAVGGNLQILEWLAKDSGGTHVGHP